MKNTEWKSIEFQFHAKNNKILEIPRTGTQNNGFSSNQNVQYWKYIETEMSRIGKTSNWNCNEFYNLEKMT